MSVHNRQKITDEMITRITEAALCHPKRGPRRLASLLKREGISISATTIYRVLRAEGLHTREKRRKRAEVMHMEAAVRSTKTQPLADVKPPPAPPPPDRQPVFETLTRSRRSKRGIFADMSGPISWGLRLFQAALVMLAVCLGVYTALQINDTRNAKNTVVAVPQTDDLQLTPERKTDLRSIHNYRATLKRDLFGTAATDQSIRRQAPTVDAIPQAPKDLGLKLVGTAAAEIQGLSVAVIENSKTRAQEPFREGDRIGDLRIKKILRSSVILMTDAGEVLLTMGDGSGRPVGTDNEADTAIVEANRTYAIEIAKNGKVTESYSTDQKWVTASLGNHRRMKRVRFMPRKKNNRPDGLQVRMPTLHVLTRLGLRSSDVIKRINGRDAIEPLQAAEAFSRLGSGEDLVIELLRGGEPWKLSVRAG